MGQPVNGFYQITEAMFNYFNALDEVASVTLGNLSDVALKDITQYALVHIVPFDTTIGEKVNIYSFGIYAIDKVDINKFDFREMPDFRGTDNLHDAWHEMDKVLTGFVNQARRGTLWNDNFVLNGDPTMTPFKDRFEHVLAGWELTVNIEVYHGGIIC